MTMRFAVLAGLAVTALAPVHPVHGDALRRTVAPMTRADGAVCDLLRSDVGDTCKRVARDGSAAVYQSRSRSGRGSGGTTGIRRFVLAIDTGSGILVGPAIDVLDDQLESARPTLRAIAIDGHPAVALDVVSTWRRGKTADRGQSLVGCMQVGTIWKCSQIDVGSCDASLRADGSVTTSCGNSLTLAVGS